MSVDTEPSTHTLRLMTWCVIFGVPTSSFWSKARMWDCFHFSFCFMGTVTDDSFVEPLLRTFHVWRIDNPCHETTQCWIYRNARRTDLSPVVCCGSVFFDRVWKICPFLLYFCWRNKKPRVTYSRVGVVLLMFVAAAMCWCTESGWMRYLILHSSSRFDVTSGRFPLERVPATCHRWVNPPNATSSVTSLSSDNRGWVWRAWSQKKGGADADAGDQHAVG